MSQAETVTLQIVFGGNRFLVEYLQVGNLIKIKQ